MKVFSQCNDVNAIDLMSKLLVYIPQNRLTGKCFHHFA